MFTTLVCGTVDPGFRRGDEQNVIAPMLPISEQAHSRGNDDPIGSDAIGADQGAGPLIQPESDFRCKFAVFCADKIIG